MDLLLDLRLALRRLRRAPAFSATAVLLLALSIGAAASIGGLVEAVLLQPLPFRDPDRLVWIWSTRTDRDRAFFSIPDFLDHRQAAGAELAAFANWDATVSGAGDPERVPGARMTADGLQLLGVTPAAGRIFEAGDEDRRLALISHDLWRRRFGADPAAVGSTLVLNGDPYTMAGVLPAGWIFPNLEAQLLVPLDLRADPRRQARGSNFLRGFGRLRAGVSREALAAGMAEKQRRLQAMYPEDAKVTAPRVLALSDELLGAVRKPLWLLAGGVALLLLAACANLAGLLLARGAARRGELAVRAALGAGAGRLAREVLLETALVAIAGGVLGLVLAHWLLPLLVALGPRDLPRASRAGVDLAVAAAALLAACLAGVAAGIAPALQAGRGDPREALTVVTGTSSGARARRAAVLIEVALTGLLLTVAGLLGQSFLRLQGTDPGFRPEGVLVARLALPRDRYATRDSVQQFAQKILPRVSALPGARSAALGQVLPLSAMNVRADFSVVGHPPATPAEKPAAQNRWVSPGWLQTLGIPLLQGRDFSERDDGRAPGVAIADAALVRRHLGGLQPVGTRLLLEDGPEPREVEIVGVAGEVKHFALDEEPTPTLYTPAAQLTADALPFFTGRVQVVVRAAGLAPSALREAVRELDASVPADVRALDEVLVAALAPRKFQALLLLLFSGAALALAATGLYGLMAWSVAQRTREIGVRLALGATPRRVVGMVVGEGVRLAFIGLGAGLLLSAAAARLLPALLPGVVGSDVVGFLAPPLVLVAVAGAASWLAARRAASVDPAESLRAG